MAPGLIKYIQYSKPAQIATLDQRTVPLDKVSVFPRNLYSKECFAANLVEAHNPRDKNTLYTYNNDPNAAPRERSVHTPWHSRFSYDVVPWNYGAGEQAFGYVEPRECHACAADTPAKMAPQRFYTAGHLDQHLTDYDMRN